MSRTATDTATVTLEELVGHEVRWAHLEGADIHTALCGAYIEGIPAPPGYPYRCPDCDRIADARWQVKP